jgi:hypothetical protein
MPRFIFEFDMAINSAKRNTVIEKKENEKSSQGNVVPLSSSKKPPVIKAVNPNTRDAESFRRVKEKSNAFNKACAEDDGAALSGRPLNEGNDSSEESGESNTPVWWDQRYSEAVLELETVAKKRAMQRIKVETQRAKLETKSPVCETDESESSEDSNGLDASLPSRLQAINLIIRDRTKSMTFFSPRKDSVPEISLNSLAAAEWVPSGVSGKDENAIVDRIPMKIRKELASEYRAFSSRQTTQPLQGDARELALRKCLALKFLSEALLGKASGFAKAKIHSRTEINDYLSRTYGFRISKAAEKFSSSSSSLSSPKSRDQSSNVVSMLALDAMSLSKNYRVDYSIDLRNLEPDPFIKKNYLATLAAVRTTQKVSDEYSKKKDLGGIFVRDFDKSAYEYQGPDGNIKPITSIDEFIALIGDPENCQLPREISLFACQTLGLFIKNILFTRPNASGVMESPVKLYDGTSVSISISPKVLYRLRKNTDGSIVLSYRAEYDSTGALAQGRNSASTLKLGSKSMETKGVVIDGAKATVSLDIVFYTNAAFQMGALKLEAEGWNVVDA